jgi:hypothetical protein
MPAVQLKFKEGTGAGVALDGAVFRRHADEPVKGPPLPLRPTLSQTLELAEGFYGYQFDVIEGSGKFTLRVVDPATGKDVTDPADYDTDADGPQPFNLPFPVGAP